MFPVNPSWGSGYLYPIHWAAAGSTFVLNNNALALNMQGNAYNKEIDAEIELCLWIYILSILCSNARAPVAQW